MFIKTFYALNREKGKVFTFNKFKKQSPYSKDQKMFESDGYVYRHRNVRPIEG